MLESNTWAITSHTSSRKVTKYLQESGGTVWRECSLETSSLELCAFPANVTLVVLCKRLASKFPFVRRGWNNTDFVVSLVMHCTQCLVNRRLSVYIILYFHMPDLTFHWGKRDPDVFLWTNREEFGVIIPLILGLVGKTAAQWDPSVAVQLLIVTWSGPTKVLRTEI